MNFSEPHSSMSLILSLVFDFWLKWWTLSSMLVFLMELSLAAVALKPVLGSIMAYLVVSSSS